MTAQEIDWLVREIWFFTDGDTELCNAFLLQLSDIESLPETSEVNH